MDKIIIQDLTVSCVIGVNAEERFYRQQLLITVTLFTDLRTAGNTDALDDTVDYKVLTRQILERIENSDYRLVESVAEEIARICLAEPRVVRVRVRVDKPGALRCARAAAVEIERDRSSDRTQSS